MKTLLLLCTVLLSSLTLAADIEEPGWELLTTLGKIEIRQYEPSIQAVTRLRSSRGTSAGFRRLAGYIFGGNEREQSIAMTAPVQETLGQGRPEMAFTLPAEYTMADLPAPNDSDVTLRAVSGRTVAAIRFSGWATGRKVAQNETVLMAKLQEHGIETAGLPMLNQYNPPWTPPFLRRNEVAVTIEWGDEVAALD